MPEGPELFLSSLFINRVCQNVIFTGRPARNPIHKCQDINWDVPKYTVSSESRGKELKLFLRSCEAESKKKQNDSVSSILFTFGMSGKFEFVPADSLPKHSHLTFFTLKEPKMGLAFVDYRRFGKWVEGGQWSVDRGPCIIQEHSQFVKSLAANLDKSAFNKPICEVMLNQKFFNGLGNYLRAEILFRCKVAPFEKARCVLQADPTKNQSKMASEDIKTESKHKVKKEEPQIEELEKKEINYGGKLKETVKTEVLEQAENKELLDIYGPFSNKGQELLKLCGSVPLEVIEIGSKKNSLSEMYVDDTSGSYHAWLKCYYQEGMKNMADHNNRTIWFSGPAGPMVPKEQKSRGKKKVKKAPAKDEIQEANQDVLPDLDNPKELKKPTGKPLTRKKLKEVKEKIKQITNGVEKVQSTKTARSVKGSSTKKKRKNESSDESVVTKRMKKDGDQTNQRMTRSRLLRGQ